MKEGREELASSMLLGRFPCLLFLQGKRKGNPALEPDASFPLFAFCFWGKPVKTAHFRAGAAHVETKPGARELLQDPPSYF